MKDDLIQLLEDATAAHTALLGILEEEENYLSIALSSSPWPEVCCKVMDSRFSLYYSMGGLITIRGEGYDDRILRTVDADFLAIIIRHLSALRHELKRRAEEFLQAAEVSGVTIPSDRTNND